MQFKLELKGTKDKETIGKSIEAVRNMVDTVADQINRLLSQRAIDINHLNSLWKNACYEEILAGGQSFTKDQVVDYITNDRVNVTIEDGVATWSLPDIPKPKQSTG